MSAGPNNHSKLVDELRDTLKKSLLSPESEELRALILPIEKQLRKQIRRKILCFLLALAALFSGLFGLFFYTPLYYHLRAVGRIGLIQLTPYWDWRDYYHQDCLVKNDFRSPPQFRRPSCTLCEDISDVDVVSNVSSRLFTDHYLAQELPVIVSDGALDWPVFQDFHFGLKDIIQAHQRDDSSWDICNLMTNIVLRDDNLQDFYQQIERNPERPWFTHWENCYGKSVKTGRRFYPRPYFISSAVDLSFNNWVVASHRYPARTLKKVRLRSSIAMFAQIRGSNYLRLIPDSLCEEHCATLEIKLTEGEIFLLFPKRWNLEYQPAEESQNLALIIQGEVD